MNISTIALLIFAWQLLGNKGNSPPKIDDFAQLLNDDTRDILSCVSKLSSRDATNEDKTGAIFQMMTNPTVMNFAQNIFGNSKADSSNNQTTSGNFGTDTTYSQPKAPTNDEGYVFDRPSATSQEFFAPINNIADAEIKHKLYWFYDNWYLAK